MFSFELTPVSFLTQKMLLKNAGVKGQKTVFLLTDTQIKDEAFLEDVDSILNTGEVPNLFAMDEKQEIMEVKPSILHDEQSGTLIYFISLPQTICPIAQGGNKNLELSPLALFAFFVTRCRENLHIVVAFSPIGDAFRNRLRQFPSLINCCTIDWFQVGVCAYGILKSSVFLSRPERKFNEDKGRTRDDQYTSSIHLLGFGIL